MSLINRRKQIEEGVPTSSMADIAFLLLVFFLVTTVFPKDRGLALVLPQGEVHVTAANVLHLLVDASGTVGVRRGASPQTQFVRTQDVGAIWTSAVAENPDLIAALKTDLDAEYGRMVDVLDQLQSVGAERVSLQGNGN